MEFYDLCSTHLMKDNERENLEHLSTYWLKIKTYH